MIAAALNEEAQEKKIKRCIKITKIPIAEMWGDKQQGRMASETDQWLAATAKNRGESKWDTL